MINKLLDMKLPQRIAVTFFASLTVIVFLSLLIGVLFGYTLHDATITGIKIGFITGMMNAMFILIAGE